MPQEEPQESTAPAGAEDDQPASTIASDDQLIGADSGWGGVSKMEQAAAPTAEKAEVRPESARCSACCGCIALLVALLLAVAGYLYYDYRQAHSDPLVNEYTDLGYTIVRGAIINVDKPCETKTLFLAKQVNFNADQKVDLAVRAPACSVSGRIASRLYFEGKFIVIKTGASVNELTGSADTLDLVGELKFDHIHATTITRH